MNAPKCLECAPHPWARMGISEAKVVLDASKETDVIARATTTSAGRHPDAPFADRKHVFGDNTLPVKKPLNSDS